MSSPTRNTTAPRTLASAEVGREVFDALNRTEVVVGALLFAASAPLVTRAGADSSKSSAAVALAQYFWARPRMSAVTEGLDLATRYEGDARLYVLRRWHKTYVALNFLKLALGLSALAPWILRSRARRGSPLHVLT